jgi:hypothetical protein
MVPIELRTRARARAAGSQPPLYRLNTWVGCFLGVYKPLEYILQALVGAALASFTPCRTVTACRS